MTTATTSFKRPRALSNSSSPSFPGSSDPPNKASRIVDYSTSYFENSTTGSSGSVALQTNYPLYCNLPPTCHHRPTPLKDTNDLERHYATHHAFVCETDKCGCVFTDARLLELHQIECHDPLAALRKERGEKIFQCHIPAPTCGRSFLTPKARRLHLIQAHGYPKEYFFAVTNKGIGGLLKKWGDGVSMIRKEWKPRRQEGGKDVDMKGYRDEEAMDEDDDEEGEEEEEEEAAEDEDEVDESSDVDEGLADPEATPRMLPRTTGIHSPQSSVSSSSRGTAHPHGNSQSRSPPSKNSGTNDIANITNSLDSLALVPNSVRFNRGMRGGFTQQAKGHRRRGRGRGGGRGGVTPAQRMNVDHPEPGVAVRGGRGGDSGHADSGLGARARGRGRVIPPRPAGRGGGRARGFER